VQVLYFNHARFPLVLLISLFSSVFSALAMLMVIGVGELLRTGQEIVAVNFRAFEVYMAVAMVYLVMTMSSEVSLRLMMNWLPSGGIMRLKACGQMM